jgi:hypothetical protein
MKNYIKLILFVFLVSLNYQCKKENNIPIIAIESPLLQEGANINIDEIKKFIPESYKVKKISCL